MADMNDYYKGESIKTIMGSWYAVVKRMADSQHGSFIILIVNHMGE